MFLETRGSKGLPTFIPRLALSFASMLILIMSSSSIVNAQDAPEKEVAALERFDDELSKYEKLLSFESQGEVAGLVKIYGKDPSFWPAQKLEAYFYLKFGQWLPAWKIKEDPFWIAREEMVRRDVAKEVVLPVGKGFADIGKAVVIAVGFVHGLTAGIAHGMETIALVEAGNAIAGELPGTGDLTAAEAEKRLAEVRALRQRIRQRIAELKKLLGFAPTVIDSMTGKPVPGLAVKVIDVNTGSSVASLSTESTGSAKFFLAPRTYNVKVAVSLPVLTTKIPMNLVSTYLTLDGPTELNIIVSALFMPTQLVEPLAGLSTSLVGGLIASAVTSLIGKRIPPIASRRRVSKWVPRAMGLATFAASYAPRVRSTVRVVRSLF